MVTQAEIEAAAKAYAVGCTCELCLERMRAALEAAAKARWQPIETAPIQVEDFIVGGPTKVTLGWRRDGEVFQWDGDEKPTHWQPFMDPPD